MLTGTIHHPAAGEGGWRVDGGRMEEGWRKDGGSMEGGWGAIKKQRTPGNKGINRKIEGNRTKDN